ncbi:mammalian ependymin-related protein 1 [Malurus melanocephalus]|uniref:mammalian ependymin-related protein 1 n=1 Tax=Malurus melanocephalus TaxID=175006 RepID=UPI0025478A29|nr:mammalian ependymin-related protein 1 [Malurus melanocephalus]
MAAGLPPPGTAVPPVFPLEDAAELQRRSISGAQASPSLRSSRRVPGAWSSHCCPSGHPSRSSGHGQRAQTLRLRGGRGCPWPVTALEQGRCGGSRLRPPRFFEYILLYKDAVMFQIEQVTKLCSKIALTEPWDPYDIPANSTYEDQYYIGGPGDEIMVQEWSDRKPARKSESWVGVYTVKDCYPVQETYTKNYSVTTSTRFFDIHLGIADPSVFTPPSTCQTAQLTRMKDEC